MSPGKPEPVLPGMAVIKGVKKGTYLGGVLKQMNKSPTIMHVLRLQSY